MAPKMYIHFVLLQSIISLAFFLILSHFLSAGSLFCTSRKIASFLNEDCTTILYTE